jgi:hypothetical protein
MVDRKYFENMLEKTNEVRVHPNEEHVKCKNLLKYLLVNGYFANDDLVLNQVRQALSDCDSAQVFR